MVFLSCNEASRAVSLLEVKKKTQFGRHLFLMGKDEDVRLMDDWLRCVCIYLSPCTVKLSRKSDHLDFSL